MRISEEIKFAGARFIESNGSRVINHVALVGTQSQQGHSYTLEALRAAVPLYQGCRCFINHPSDADQRTGRRDLMALAGVVENPRFESNRIFGSIKLLPDKYGDKFFNIARHMPEAASCSHVADGTLRNVGGQMVCESIKAVLSVDLVVMGATTTSIFESQDGGGDKDDGYDALVGDDGRVESVMHSAGDDGGGMDPGANSLIAPVTATLAEGGGQDQADNRIESDNQDRGGGVRNMGPKSGQDSDDADFDSGYAALTT